jgi:hypothetical protein
MYGLSTKTKLLNEGELAYLEYEGCNIISVIRELITKDEQTLRDSVINLKKKIKEDKTIDDLKDEPELQSSYYHNMYEEEIQFIHEIQRQQRYSKLLILFVFYEDSLRKISEILEQKSSQKKEKKSKGINDLEVYWNHIVSTPYLDPKVSQESFDYINSQKFIRDKIAHKNGVYAKSEAKVGKYEFVKKKGLSQIEYGNEYKIKIDDPVYLTDLTEQIKTNLISIIHAVDNALQRARDLVSHENKFN